MYIIYIYEYLRLLILMHVYAYITYTYINAHVYLYTFIPKYLLILQPISRKRPGRLMHEYMCVRVYSCMNIYTSDIHIYIYIHVYSCVLHT